MAHVHVEFPVAHHVGDTATRMRELLVDRFADCPEIDRVSLRPLERPVFGVVVDGERIWSAPVHDRIDPREPVEAIRTWLGR